MQYSKLYCFPLVFAMLVLFACKQNQHQEQYKRNPLLTDNEEILGNWVMCSWSDGVTMFQANACASVRFSEYGFGQVSYISGKTEAFTWKLEKGKLSLHNFRKSPEKTFYDSAYKTSFIKKGDLLELTLDGVGRKCSYYLSK